MRGRVWIIIVAAVCLAAGAVFLADRWSGDSEPQTLKGPVAVFRGGVPKQGFLGLEFAPGSGAALKVKTVVPQSGAARAGLQVDDVLVGIAGKRVSKIEDVLAACTSTKPGDLLQVSIRRGNEAEERRFDVKLISAVEMVTWRRNTSKGSPTTAQ